MEREVSKPHRTAWCNRRREMEVGEEKYTLLGGKSKRHWGHSLLLFRALARCLRLIGLYEMGVRNAEDIQTKRIEFWFDDLPDAFDGFSILQLSDLHVDCLPRIIENAIGLISARPVDLCVLTGDYQDRFSEPLDRVVSGIQRLTSKIQARHGILAVLGNHDCADIVAPLEQTGISCLINETISVTRGDAAISVTGLDDVHYYFTDAAPAALERSPEGFKIALVHSPELAGAVAAQGFRLYLTGHTHGGQISLPGGRPIITHLACFHRYARGWWRHERMAGYTSSGLGVSGLPVRFNTRGEVVFITLKQAKPGQNSARIL